MRHITVARIEDWQMQARLVCTIPWLRGTHAQLLVGAGYTTPGDIHSASIDDLSSGILKFAATRNGQRILRDGDPPDIEKIIKWADYASLAELDRALGTLYAQVEQCFQSLLRIGFRSRFA